MKYCPQLQLPVLFFFLLFLLPACKDKPTIIKGVVTDRKTGKPLENVSVQAGGMRPGEKGLMDYFSVDAYSNANGEYECVLDGDYYARTLVTKKGYVTLVSKMKIEDGAVNTVDISIVPKNGFIRLVALNTTGVHDTIFPAFYSNIMALESGQGALSTEIYPLTLKLNEMYSETYAIATPDQAKIYWSFSKPSSAKPFEYEAIVPVAAGDTAVYVLKY